MPSMHARVNTAEPDRLINRLCKHFRHKIEAEWTESEGLLTFSIGECRLNAAGGELLLACQSPTEEQLEQLGEVVASHLLRFAGGDVAGVHWQSAA